MAKDAKFYTNTEANNSIQNNNEKQRGKKSKANSKSLSFLLLIF